MPSGNFLYPWARNKFLRGQLAWTTGTNYKVMFVNAGVATNYIWSATGASGYAWNPVNDAVSTPAGAGYGISFLSQIPTGHRTMTASYGGISGAANTLGILTDNGTVVGNGIANAAYASTTQYAVQSGAAISAFVIYKDDSLINWTAANASSYSYDATMDLVAFFDSAIGMPVQGNGGDITIVWDTSANKIFKL